VPIRYLKLYTTNQPKLACGWPSHHYLCANYSPCKPAKLVAHQFLQGRSCCKVLSYGVKRMAPSLPVLLSAMPSFRVSHSQSSLPFFFYFKKQTWPFKPLAPPSQAQWQRAQFSCLPCPLSVFHTYKAPSLFSFILRRQWQTWPVKLLGPPSQPQWQRAQFLCAMPCPLSVFHTHKPPINWEAHQIFPHLPNLLHKTWWDLFNPLHHGFPSFHNSTLDS